MERYDSYKDSGVEWIGEVPSHWEVAKTKRLLQIGNGSDPTTNGDIPVFGSSGTSFKTCGQTKKYPSVLLGRKGTIDKPSYVGKPFWNVDTAFDVHPKSEGYNLRYFFYESQLFDYDCYRTDTAVPSMTQSNYAEMALSVPSVTEQKLIADYLDEKTAEIDSLIEKTERSIKLLEEYRKSVISEAVTKGLDPNVPMKDSGIEWIGEIPAHWQVVKLTCVATRRSGHTPDKKVRAYWEDGDIVWVSLADSPKLRSQRYINSSSSLTTQAGIDHSSAELLPKGSVLLSRDATVGLCAIADCELAVSQHFMAYECGDQLNNEYLLDAFRAMAQEFEKLSMGSTIPTIGLPEVKAFKIPLPPLHEQNEIESALARRTSAIGSLLSAKHRTLALLREYRKSLISEAVTGKFKVPGVK